jgi:protein arginine N-methyltransferase 1
MSTTLPLLRERPGTDGGPPSNGQGPDDGAFPPPAALFPLTLIPQLFEYPAVHWQMVYDERRTGAFARAIAGTVRAGDVVVDIGTGTGLLALLSARAGARRVHAIDSSPVLVQWARELAEANGLADRIVFHPGHSRDVCLGERADVVVSEVIGYLAFEEGIVPTLADARQRFLRPGGQLIPRAVALYAAPVCERQVWPTWVDGWRPVHGLDYTPMRRHALHTLYYAALAEEDLLAEPQPVLAADLLHGTGPEPEARRRFGVTRAGTVNGVGLWFRATLADGVALSSGPGDRASSWGQAFVPIACPIRVGRGDELEVVVALRLGDGRGGQCEFAAQVWAG